MKGHALKMEWSGEYGQESSSTGYCKCGWEESASSQREVRNEYRFHLRRVQQLTGDGYQAPMDGPSYYSPWLTNREVTP